MSWEFIITNGFFEDFCRRLLEDSDLSTAIFGTLQLQMTIDSAQLLSTQKEHIQGLLDIAETSIRKTGLSTFQDRQRFLPG